MSLQLAFLLNRSYIIIERALMIFTFTKCCKNAWDSDSCCACACLPLSMRHKYDCFNLCQITIGRQRQNQPLSLPWALLLNQSYILIERALMVYTLTKCCKNACTSASTSASCCAFLCLLLLVQPQIQLFQFVSHPSTVNLWVLLLNKSYITIEDSTDDTLA